MTPSEELVARLCRRSFLALWSVANPKGKKGKELCDVLVVCEPDIVIFSIKEIRLQETADAGVAEERWRRKAIEESRKQLEGAERWIAKNDRIVGALGGSDLLLPPKQIRRIHRVVVALGGQGLAPIAVSDASGSVVHVLDEESLDAIMQELDTISDFVEYLIAKEAFLLRGHPVLVPGGEADLLGVYVNDGRRFPTINEPIRIEPGSWARLQAKPEFKARVTLNSASYAWDGLIDIFGEDALAGTLIGGATLEGTERALRCMARESRFARRILGKSWLEFHEAATRRELRSRIAKSPSGVDYVFLAGPHEESREDRQTELLARCLVARSLDGASEIIVGIATEHYIPEKGFSLDLYVLDMPEWTKEHARRAAEIQREGGFFVAPRITESREDEYPSIGGG